MEYKEVKELNFLKNVIKLYTNIFGFEYILK